MRRVAVLLALLALSASDVFAQDTVIVYVDRYVDASSGPARRAVSIFNASRTTRFFGEATIPRNRRIRGDVGVLDGPLVIGGDVLGDVVALNSDVILRRGAFVRGDITVFGGDIFGLDDATVRGNTRSYRSSIRVVREGRRVRLREDRSAARRPPRIVGRDRGRSDFSITVRADTYNRVEGLPLGIGPRWRSPFGEFGTLTLEGLAIVRTAGDLNDNREDLGYEARVELGLGPSDDVTVGVTAYDVVSPVEAWTLSDNEVGWASFLWHRDYRDYFLRRGVAGYLRIKPDRAFTLSGMIARNEDASIAARDPWTPFRNDERWRINPPADEGTFTTITGRLEYDSRADPRWFGSGWYVGLEWERGQSDSVSAVPLPTSIRPPIPMPDYTYDRAVVDVRRYERVGSGGQFAVRVLGAGTIGNDPLPVQRRFSLGGPEPLPGFGFRRFACNQQVFTPGRAALCDRIVLLQAEYRQNFSYYSPWDDDGRRRRRRDHNRYVNGFWDWDDWFWFDGPAFVLFGNAGTGWIDVDGPGNLEWDVGAGITFGGFGIYAAKAVSEDESIRIRLRLNRRF